MIVLASHNPTKTKVLADAFKEAGLDTVSAGTLGLDEPEENGDTLAANALTKARAAAQATGLVAVADDSGLFVPVLDGGPGVKTADWSFCDTGRDWTLAMAKIHKAVLERGASFPVMGAFVATLVVAFPDGSHKVFTGEQGGNVVWPPRGDGFALDPIFQPFGARAPLSMLDKVEADAFNHRGRVARRVAAWLKAQPAFSAPQEESVTA